MHDDALPGAGIAPVRVTGAARLFSRDELIAAILENLFAAAATRPDQILQTRCRVLSVGGLRQQESGGERSQRIACLLYTS